MHGGDDSSRTKLEGYTVAIDSGWMRIRLEDAGV
jgi:hypothetical protein